MSKPAKSGRSIPIVPNGGAIFEGFPFSADDIKAVSQKSHVKTNGPDFGAASSIINGAIAGFVGIARAASSPSEFSDWYDAIDNQCRELLSLFGSSTDPDELFRSRFIFFRHSQAMFRNGFGVDDFGQALLDVVRLRDAARAASAEAKGKQKAGRPADGAQNHLNDGMLEGWRALTQKRSGGVSKSAGSSEPWGPFIAFCADVFREAATKLDATGDSHLAVAASELRLLAESPHKIAGAQRETRRKGKNAPKKSATSAP